MTLSNVFFYVISVVSIAISTEIAINNRPSVGIIRWDAWNLFNNQYDPISFYLHRALSPEKFHYRIPFYASVLSPTNISFNGDLQNVMDQEILYAKHAGIDYWAFDTYCQFGSNCTTNNTYCSQYYTQTSNLYCPRNPAYGLNLYLSSEYKSLLNFTFILLGSSPCDASFQQSYIDLMKLPQFQTVRGGRPLLYLFQFDNAEADKCGGGWLGSGQVFQKFRQMAISQGLQNPYLVLMDFDVRTVQSHASMLGFDAISTYALPGGTIDGTPFVELFNSAQRWWQSASDIGAKIVPIAPTGWDPRPRAENPVPWVNEGPEHYIQPTVEELQQLIRSGINFTCTHNQTAEAQTIIIYAWNESSETSGSLVPSMGNGTLYIDALSKILPMFC
ncbi:unnamed protein product [Rotaria socialis]|uniref:Uncharacterized protein n=1 Tax=Rotaria socialis TaxID=392032 RepID=A0A817SW29_9BILA|nr:unnamed protein product [Rotaria socialis]CAF3306384.1 unnamed protein product [Rotaria socialis]CAF3682916.1 unnamed protein product [Rotaria socialis]CAF3725177.1 unnamed protein product [Rotaria socialis]CAF4382329.1 unnamed protein product [Rotaria socialis]